MQLFNANIILDLLTDFSSIFFIRPIRILASRYKPQTSLSKIPNFIFSTLASNQPCLLGLSCAGSSSVNTPKSELAAASTHNSTSPFLRQFGFSGTLVLTKLGSHIAAFVIPCIISPEGLNTKPSPEKSSSAASVFPLKDPGIEPFKWNQALSHFLAQLPPSLIST